MLARNHLLTDAVVSIRTVYLPVGSLVALCGCMPEALPISTNDPDTRCLYDVLTVTPGVSAVKLYSEPMPYYRQYLFSGPKEYFARTQIDYSFRDSSGVTRPYTVWLDNSPFDARFDSPLRDYKPLEPGHPIKVAADQLAARCNIQVAVEIILYGGRDGIVLKATSFR